MTDAQVELVVYHKQKKTDAVILICRRTAISSIMHSQGKLAPHKETIPRIKKDSS